MKTLTRALLVIAGLASVSLPAFAVESAAPRGDRPALRAAGLRHAAIRQRIAKRLNLTDAQKEQLKAQRSQTKSALQALRSDASLTKEQKHAKARELMANSRTNVQSVLTPEQQKQLQHLRGRLHQRRR